MKVKKLLGILISLMMITLFAGCGSSGGGNSGAVLSELKLAIANDTTNQNSKYELPSAKAIYDNDEEKEVEVTWLPSVVDTSKVGTKVYKASYTENAVTKTATFTLTVKANSKLVSIKLDSATGTIGLDDKDYTLPKTATAEYEDGTTAIVTVKWNETVETSIEGDTDYVASYTENGITKTATFTLTVIDGFVDKMKSLVFATDSITVNKNAKVALPTTAILTYESLKTKEVKVTWTTTEVDTSAAGTKTYKATYKETYTDGTTGTKTAMYKVIVLEEKIVETFTIAKTSDSVEVGKTYTLPATGTITYDDASTETVNVTWDKIVSTTTAGTYSYTGSCSKTDIKVTFKLTVSTITTEPTFEISDLAGTASGYINVKISGKNFKEAVSGVDFTLEYDSKYLSLEGENDVTFLNGFKDALKIVMNNSGKLTIAGAGTGNNDFSVNGDIIQIRFKASTTKGATAITVVSASTAVISGNKQIATDVAVTDKGEITIK